jgi:hypothetical protein
MFPRDLFMSTYFHDIIKNSIVFPWSPKISDLSVCVITIIVMLCCVSVSNWHESFFMTIASWEDFGDAIG